MLDALGKGACLAFGLDLACVGVEGGGLVRKLDLGAVSVGDGARLQHPGHGVVHVGAGRGLVIVHDAVGRKHVVDHVARHGNGEGNPHVELSVAKGNAAVTNALIGHVDGLLEGAHVLLGRGSAAGRGVKGFHRNLKL